MINLKELKLYNWVYSLEIGEYVQIASIYSEFVTLKNHATWGHVYTDMIEPIPLIEEILLKCGFDYGTDDGINHWFSKDDFYINKSDWGDNFILECFNIEIKHLHQLQNLYFAITGQELKIEL